MIEKESPKPAHEQKALQFLLHYPSLENLLDTPHPDFSSMEKHLQLAKDMGERGKSPKEKLEAHQVFLAYTRFFEVFKELTQLKTHLCEIQKNPPEKSKK